MDLTSEIAPPPAPVYSHLPCKSVVVYAQGEDKAPKAVEKAAATMPAAARCRVDLEELAAVIGASSRYHASTVPNASYDALLSLLEASEAGSLFPIIDLLRLASLHPCSGKRERLGYWRRVIDLVSRSMSAVPPSDVPVRMLGYRLMCNLLKVRAFYGTDLWGTERVKGLCAAVTASWGEAGKNVKSR